jgi:peroxiredoxin
LLKNSLSRKGQSRRRLLGVIAGAPWLLSCQPDNFVNSDVLKGKPLPDFSLPDLSGNLKSSFDFKGRPLLLNFWATWCAPCRAEMASLENIHREFKPSGLSLIGISVDEDLNLVREFLLQEGIGFDVLSDPKSLVSASVFGVSALPLTLLIGRSGVVQRVELGERQWDQMPAKGWVAGLFD